MAMCTVVQAGLNALCHCYTRLRALTASRRHPATNSKELLQAYCKSCMRCSTHSDFLFATTLETFQAGSSKQPHSTQRPNRRVGYHMNTLSHREMVAFFAPYSGLKQKSRILGRIHCLHHRMFDSYLHLTCSAAPHVEDAVNTSSSRMVPGFLRFPRCPGG